MTSYNNRVYNGNEGSPILANLDKLNNQQIQERIGEDMELIDYVRYWLETVKQMKVKPATYDRLMTSIEALSKYSIAHKPIGELTADDCESYVVSPAQTHNSSHRRNREF